jgi:hypothetical protein
MFYLISAVFKTTIFFLLFYFIIILELDLFNPSARGHLGRYISWKLLVSIVKSSSRQSNYFPGLSEECLEKCFTLFITILNNLIQYS